MDAYRPSSQYLLLYRASLSSPSVGSSSQETINLSCSNLSQNPAEASQASVEISSHDCLNSIICSYQQSFNDIRNHIIRSKLIDAIPSSGVCKWRTEVLPRSTSSLRTRMCSPPQQINFRMASKGEINRKILWKVCLYRFASQTV